MGPALAQAPAPAAKPVIPQVCTNCHKAQPNAAAGGLRKRRVQEPVDPAQDRRAHGNRALRPEDDQGRRRRRGEARRGAARHRQEPRGAHRLRREGRREARHADLVQGPDQDRAREAVELCRDRAAGRAGAGAGQVHADRLAAAAARAGRHDPDRDQPALPGLGQVRRPPAHGQEPVHDLLLPGRHLHDEPELAAEGRGARATPTSRSTAKAIPSGWRRTSA